MTITINGDTGIAGVDGTASVPAVQGTDTNTGLFYPAADTVGLSTGGSERMRVDSSGNVGIGTSSPSTILDIYSGTGANFSVRGDAGTNITASRYSTDANPPNINLRKGRGTNDSPTAVASGDSLGNLWFAAYGGANFRNLSYVASRVSTYTSDTDISSFLSFGTSPSGSAAATERMRIDSSGNVGIGTTSAIATLDVNGEMRTASSANWNYAALNVVRKSSNTSTPRMISMALGGDDSASTTIGAYNAIWGIYNASPSASSTSSALQGEMAYAAYYGHRWYNNGTERMRIDSSGKVLVNLTSGIGADAAPFQVYGGNVTSIAVKCGTNDYFQAFYNASNTLIGSITRSGSNTAYNTSSDYRLKDDIQPMVSGLATVSALKPVTYKWKEDGAYAEGFIAHELQEVIPLAVTGEKDAVDDEGNIKPQGVDYSKIVVHLVAAIQELKATVDAQAAEIAALKALK